ncbi:hypothetical protein [Algoriphagus pacificus]|uniref:Uncharacterized protein n=1 Tax=Algoriphagus pacificus TaxID=2811234 RepID=A0ABS3CGA1_9BACT|nr:hypothetical protein [Algoriphagus pacificus]MBN7815549.1 hypothetical protein [Algoriphagus pacificus]
MIKFFRKIRKKLIQENRLKNYLIYASGEIVLVVIGILIALAINNANLKRIERNQEQNYLQGLQDEFQISKMKLTELISVNQQSLESSKMLVKMMQQATEDISEKELSELLFQSFSNDITFNSNNSLLNEMINSGSLKDISNIDLRRQLTTWVATLEDIKNQEEELSLQREYVLDLFREDEYSMQTVLSYAGAMDALGLPVSGQQKSNFSILNSQKFENNLLTFILTSEATKSSHYDPLMKDLNEILEKIEEELED